MNRLAPIIPADLLQDPAWRAVLHIFLGVFAGDARVWKHVDLDRATLDFDGIFAEGTCSGGEATPLRLAAAMFNEEYSVNLWDSIPHLGDTYWHLVLEALKQLRSRP